VFAEAAPFHVGSFVIPSQPAELVILICMALMLRGLVPYFYNYHFTETAFQCRILGFITIFSLRFDQIKCVYQRKRLFGGNLIDIFRTLALGNRFFSPALKIEKTRGLLRFVIVTPPDVNRYIDVFRARGIPTENMER